MDALHDRLLSLAVSARIEKKLKKIPPIPLQLFLGDLDSEKPAREVAATWGYNLTTQEILFLRRVMTSNDKPAEPQDESN